MTFGELKKVLDEIDESLKLTENNIDSVSLNHPVIYNKYLKVYLGELGVMAKMDAQIQKLHGERYKYYKEDYNRRMDNRQEIEEMINGEDEYAKLYGQKKNQEIIIKYLEKALDNIKNMGFDIKNFIEWKKYQSMYM